jgi:Domain of unknown function (DUF4276)/AAA domain, putative AbiEii toxin, Type IV TA system
MAAVKKLTITGYKSIRELRDFELRNLNVLIGANGAGKSNFISFFRMLAEIVGQRFQLFVAVQGGPDALLHYTRKLTDKINAELVFDGNDDAYIFTLVPTNDNRFSDIDKLCDTQPEWDRHRAVLLKVRADVTNPEWINDSPQTAPSKRLAILRPRYRKTTHGPASAVRITLDKIREQCPHFRQWFERLLQIGAQPLAARLPESIS